MSPATKAILDQIIPDMESMGYRFYKSSTTFSKRENELDYRVRIRFDGRGGLTMVDCLEFIIESPRYNRYIKKLVGDTSGSLISSGVSAYCDGRLIIPVPYSQAALDIANDMNMSKLSKLPLEDKYPENRIAKTAEFTLLRIKENAIPFFEKYATLEALYDLYLAAPENEENPLNISRYRRRLSANMIRVLFCLFMSLDLGKEMPPVLLKYKHFYKDMISGYGYMERVLDLKKNLQEMGIHYDPK